MRNMTILSGRLSKALKIARQDGFITLASRVLDVYTAPAVSFWNRDHWWQGRIVELTGNRGRIDGVAVDLSNPYIATELKSRFLRGTYEKEERQLFFRYFPTDMPIIELGGCIGVLACITNRHLTSPEGHLVVEANPHLLTTLDQNRRMNQCHFEIVNAALAYGSDQVTFYLHELFVGGSVQRATNLSVTVPARSLQALAEAEGFDRFNLICDVEGGEVELVNHEVIYLREHVGWLLVEMHGFIVGQDQIEATDTLLRDHGFELVERLHGTYCYRNPRLVS